MYTSIVIYYVVPSQNKAINALYNIYICMQSYTINVYSIKRINRVLY